MYTSVYECTRAKIYFSCIPIHGQEQESIYFVVSGDCTVEIYTYTYIYVHIYVYINIHIYICIYIDNTYIYIQIYT